MEFLLGNTAVLVWMVLMILFLVLEAATAALISIWFAAGALAGMVIALIGLPIWLQILVFLAVSGIILLLAKPLTEQLVNQKTVKTNADRVIGALAVVTADIDNLAACGQAEVLGQLWSARSEDGKPISRGATVRVKAIEGAKLLVEQVKEEA